MVSRKRVAAAIAAACAVYLVWPYATLYRLAEAIRHGDAATLETLVDWDGVREGIKEDICDTVFEPQVKVASAEARLPPFGYSFVRGIAANAIDEQISPEALVSAARSGEKAPAAPSGGNPSIAWAFFDGPTTFSVVLRPPGATAGATAKDTPIRLELAFQHGAWKVTRAWLPPEMLMQANRT
jgi:hypothetical protein